MILSQNFVNPTNNQQEVLTLKYPNVDYFQFKHTREYNTDKDLTSILNNILKNLDCSVECEGKRLRAIKFPIYSMILSEYYFYLSRINNQILYNKYIDKVVERHIDNIIFEYEHPNDIYTHKRKATSKRTKLPPNKFVKQITHNLFTGEETYIYYNPRTKEEISSDNPDLLDELNNKKKVTKTKNVGVPINAMTFSFKKK